MFSFAVSAALVLFAIIFGYLTDLLPESTLTQLDYYIIDRLPIPQWPKHILLPFCALSSQFKHMSPRIFGTEAKPDLDEIEVDERATRAQRRENLAQFILALSDQQLVTGLAVLIPGYCQVCSVSMYHFNIVTSLTWFSSVTHLATLGVLRMYLAASPAFRNWRVFAMGLLFVMLFIALPVSETELEWHLPVSCFFSKFRIGEFPNSPPIHSTLVKDFS